MRGVELDREAEKEMTDLIRFHNVYSTNTSTTAGKYVRTKNFKSQYNSKIDNVICTCKPKCRETGYFSTSRQVYRSQRYIARESKDIGIGSVKTVYKKRVRRVYLPAKEERGTGSTDLSSYVNRKRRHRTGKYYEIKKTSSKCVGGVMEDNKISVLDKKVSPIVQTISGSTSPMKSFIKNNSVPKNIISEKYLNNKIHHVSSSEKVQTHRDNARLIVPNNNNIKIHTENNKNYSKDSSSDSLVQHIHDLENPSNDRIKTSTDFIENKLEKEYREMFTIDRKEETFSDIKSASLLRRRFEALRKGLNKKELVKRDLVTIKVSSKISVPSRKDVSIASDPPSLEARSYTNTKTHSPKSSFTNPPNTRYDEEEINSNVPVHNIESEYQNVNGMFKLWEEKFNFEESSYKRTSPNASYSKKQRKKVKLDVPIEEPEIKKKKEGRRFLFFGKKNKNKKQPFKSSKQGVTAGRCELGDGLMIKIGTVNNYPSEITSRTNRNYENYNISTKDWFKRYVNNKIDSRNSVRIRWNNNMYKTSSSTVFEMMDCVYKNTGILFSSRSEITSGGPSYYHSFTHPQINFMQQSIQAWMIPKTITDFKNIFPEPIEKLRPKKQENNIEITFSNKNWFIEKSKAFAQKVELVLHSKNILSSEKSKSSEYIVIDIPQDYFSDTTSSEGRGTYQTSDEQVYNIVEYEAVKSDLFFGNRKNSEIVNKKSRILKNKEQIEDSSLYAQKRDFISVGIITQRDIRDVKKPILKITDGVDDESKHVLPPPKTCEFAESFIQDYYRNWTTLGNDLLSWCLSDNQLRRPSEANSVCSFNNQGDGSKSCLNISDDYRASTIVSSCETSSCSHCIAFDEGKKADDSKTTTFFSKFKKKNNEQSQQSSNEKRVWPKDSYEVYKRRKLYATSNKSKWGVGWDQCNSFLNNNAQKTRIEQPRNDKICCDKDESTKDKCTKRVQLQDCEIMGEILKEQLSEKIVEGILSFKGAKGSDDCRSKNSPLKQTQILPNPTREIPQPPCKESCTEVKKPSCSKINSPSCELPKPPPCPVGPPSPCQKPCPPSPPPCQMIPPCIQSSPRPSSPKIQSSSTLNANRKPVPPRIHSPKILSPKKSHTRPCICPKKKSPCNISKCPVSKKSSSNSNPIEPASSSHLSITKSRSSSPCNCCKSKSSEKLKNTSSHDFPWPIKSQLSKAPSKESKSSLKATTSLIKNTSSKCITALKRLIKKISNPSMKQKDCKPDCANRRLLENLSPMSPTSPKPSKSKPKMPGLHLKKLPMPKTVSKDRLSQVDKGDGVIRLNSREKITIKLRQSTPSTEEIREGCNIKVQDEDGQTLFERCDYKKSNRNRMQFVKDMYRDSHVQVQRLSTPNIDTVLDEKPVETDEHKSDSTSDILEINLNLKFKQGSKATELNFKKDDDSFKIEPNSRVLHDERKLSKEVFVVQEKEAGDNSEKRDVDIKIMIKNYKTPGKLLPTNKQSVSLSADDFCNKISEKFHTVSTGYSDVIEKQSYSVHRATVDLTNSTDINKSLSKVSIELSSKILTKSIPIETFESKNIIRNEYICSSEVTDKQVYSISRTTIKSDTEINTSLEKTTGSKEKSAYSISSMNNADTNSDFLDFEGKFTRLKKYNKEDKKKILKEIFENANNEKSKGKNKMHGIRHLLRAVLTSDSSHEFNNIAKELSSTSLNPDYINDLASNCTDNTSNTTKISSDNVSEVIYPTKEITSDSSAQDNVGCLCNHVAAKLNIDKNSCCCRKYKVDEEVICNLVDRNNCNNVETQYSHIEKKNMSNQILMESEEIHSNKVLKCLSDKLDEPSDILQLNETKRAVLKIYAEKTGRRHVAKLPKFINDVAEQINNYEIIDLSKENIVLSMTR